MSELRLTIPMVPPSANHYKTMQIIHGKGKSFPHWYHTSEAKAWWKAVAVVAAGRMLKSESYEVHYVVYTARKRQLDVDNASKCLLDSLTRAGVITDDRYVDEIHGARRLDRNNPRTVILVRALQTQLF